MKLSLAVEPGLPPEPGVGVFAQPRTHDGWLRFSSGNGSPQSDGVKDLRGAAITRHDVPGERMRRPGGGRHPRPGRSEPRPVVGPHRRRWRQLRRRHPQRDSVMKAIYYTVWADESDDAAHLA